MSSKLAIPPSSASGKELHMLVFRFRYLVSLTVEADARKTAVKVASY